MLLFYLFNIFYTVKNPNKKRSTKSIVLLSFNGALKYWVGVGTL